MICGVFVGRPELSTYEQVRARSESDEPSDVKSITDMVEDRRVKPRMLIEEPR